MHTSGPLHSSEHTSARSSETSLHKLCFLEQGCTDPQVTWHPKALGRLGHAPIEPKEKRDPTDGETHERSDERPTPHVNDIGWMIDRVKWANGTFGPSGRDYSPWWLPASSEMLEMSEPAPRARGESR